MKLLQKIQTTYGSPFFVKSEASVEDYELVEKNEVVESQFGLSLCMTLQGGGRKYIPLSRDSKLDIGDSMDLSKAKVIVLGQEGSADILRIQEGE